jgi:coenzyme F420-0:L-glutamate ligase/2-phospho-L-lactate guanylyltransferase
MAGGGTLGGSGSSRATFSVFALNGIPEIEPGMDLGLILGDALAALSPHDPLHHGDILVISSKIVSKSEGRIVRADDREQAITDATVRVVATRSFAGGVTRIVENHLGIVGAAAGVDASNTPQGTVLLLPLDPDASAAHIRTVLQDRFEVALGVVISDTLGRAWREGQTDVAIGGSGVTLLDDLRGTTDTQGLRLTSSSVKVQACRSRSCAGSAISLPRMRRARECSSDHRTPTCSDWERRRPGTRASKRVSRPGSVPDGSPGALAWTVVIPVKGTASAKSRLGASPGLALAIALDSVDAAVAAAASAHPSWRVIVVTTAAMAPSFEALGAELVLDDERGLTMAIALGITAAGDGPVAVMLGDLPALRPEELVHALALAAQHPHAFVADADDDGSVLITALDAAAHRPAFGAHSRAAHRAAGYVQLSIPVDSGLRRDVDTPEHLAELASRLGPRTAALLTP